MATKKKATTTATKEVKENVENVKNTVTKVNEQIQERAKELYESGEKFVENATKTVKETVAKINFEDGYNAVKEIASKANKYTTQTAEEIVDGAIATGKEWQGIGSKAIKGGLELAAKQQEIVFQALEEVKGQFVEGSKRTRGLFKSAKESK